MKATVSLKSLRTDPRGFVDLLNQGKEVVITEHRRELARVPASKKSMPPSRGNGQAVLDAIKSLPPIKTPYPDMDTVELIKKTRLEGYERKYQERIKRHG